MSRTYHQKLVAKAKDFIRRVHSDQSVSLGQTLESLEDLYCDIEDRIAGIREDIERRKND